MAHQHKHDNEHDHQHKGQEHSKECLILCRLAQSSISEFTTW